MTLHQGGRLADAARVYERIGSIAPGLPDVDFNLGVALKGLGRADEAIVAYGRVLAVRPNDAAALNNLGNALIERGRRGEAVEAYRKAAHARSDWPVALLNLADALDEAAAAGESIGLYRRVIHLAPTWAEPYFGLATALKRCAGDPEEMVAALGQALARRPEWPLAHNNLGNALFELGRTGDAIAAYRRAVSLEPAFAEAYANIARAQQKAGDWEASAASFRRAVRLAPDLPGAVDGLAGALAGLDRLCDAADDFRMAALSARNPVGAFRHLARSLDAGGDLRQAIAACRTALVVDPAAADIHHLLARLLCRQGDIEGATDHYRICLDLDPDDALGAGLLLAGIGTAPLPAQTSRAHLLGLYRERAGREHWVQAAGTYHAPRLVAETFKAIFGECRGDVADAGCGSGLVGSLVRDWVGRLDGVDLSDEMLAHARRTGAYSSLIQGDLVEFLRQRPLCYDAVTCAGTLIHFGDLSRPFEAAAIALRDGGLFVFSLFAAPVEDAAGFRLATAEYALGGCYEHGQGYVAALASAGTHWSIESMTAVSHELDRHGVEKPGLVVALRRRPRRQTL